MLKPIYDVRKVCCKKTDILAVIDKNNFFSENSLTPLWFFQNVKMTFLMILSCSTRPDEFVDVKFVLIG